MSKYTTEVRFICENAAGLTESTGYSNIDTVLDSAREKVFDFDFPIFDESYRNVLENKILKHYYTREICCETVGLWKHFLCTRLNEIMPYYNQLYKSTLLEFNPLYDVDLTTDYQKVDNGNSSKEGSYSENGSKSIAKTDAVMEHFTEAVTDGLSGTSTDHTEGTSGETSSSETNNTDGGKNDHWEYFSNTPEGGITGVANLNYLTTALHTTDDRTGSTSGSEVEGSKSGESESDSTGTISSTRNISKVNDKSVNETENVSENNTKNGSTSDSSTMRNIEDYLHHVVGKTGGTSYSKLLDEYRKTFLNIDLKIIEELDDLFFNLW